MVVWVLIAQTVFCVKKSFGILLIWVTITFATIFTARKNKLFASILLFWIFFLLGKTIKCLGKEQNEQNERTLEIIRDEITTTLHKKCQSTGA